MAQLASQVFTTSSPAVEGRPFTDAWYRSGASVVYTLNFSANTQSTGGWRNNPWYSRYWVAGVHVRDSLLKPSTSGTIGTTQYYLSTQSGHINGSFGVGAGGANAEIAVQMFDNGWSTSMGTKYWYVWYDAAPGPSYSWINATEIGTTTARLTSGVDGKGYGLTDGGWDVSTNGGSSWTYYSGGVTDKYLSGLSPNTTYWYRGYAVTAAGGANSGWGSFTTATPALPTYSVSFDNITINSARMVMSITNNPNNYWKIHWYNTSDVWQSAGTHTTGTWYYNISGLSPNTTYTFFTRIGGEGDKNVQARENRVVTTLKPTAPTINTPIISNITESSMTITATATPGTGASILNYAFSKDNGSTWTGTQSSNSYNFTDLLDGKDYQLKVRATDNFSQTVTSITVNGTTLSSGVVKIITTNGTFKAKCFILKPDGTKIQLSKSNIKFIK